MRRHVLFVQGAGEGAHAEDEALAILLAKGLGDEYVLHYPKYMGLENIDYATWKSEVAPHLNAAERPEIVVAHSLGAAAMLKYLSEEPHDLELRGLFLVAAPYKCTDGEWGSDDFALSVDFAFRLPAMESVVMYHSEDDEWVPFAHLAQWSAKFPAAKLREFSDRGHSFSQQKFDELLDDIGRAGASDPRVRA